MSEQRTQGVTWSFATTLAAIGGFLAAVGALLPWASATGTRSTEIFGNQLLGSHSAAGIADLTGLIALVAGLTVGIVGVGALLLDAQSLRRIAGVVEIVGGAVVLAACVLAAVRLESVVGELPSSLSVADVTVTLSVQAGLVLSAAGGVVAIVGGIFARRSMPGP
jgi:hypothetical protein